MIKCWIYRLIGPSEREKRMEAALNRLRKAVLDECNSNRCGASGSDCDGCHHDARLCVIDAALRKEA